MSEDKDNAELLNFFFSNGVKNLKIPEFSDSNPLAENIPHLVFKAILKVCVRYFLSKFYFSLNDSP